jgi:hypothetical protein
MIKKKAYINDAITFNRSNSLKFKNPGADLEPHRDFFWLFFALLVVVNHTARILFIELFLNLETYITVTFDFKSSKDNEKTLMEEYLLKRCIYAVFLYKRADRIAVMHFSFLHEGCSVSQFLDKA